MLVTVLHVRRYDFKDKDSGRPVRGCEITYVRALPIVGEDRKDEKGARPSSVKGPIELYDVVTTTPGRYELELDQRSDYKGNPYLVAASIVPATSANGTGSYPAPAAPAAARS